MIEMMVYFQDGRFYFRNESGKETRSAVKDPHIWHNVKWWNDVEGNPHIRVRPNAPAQNKSEETRSEEE